MDFSIKLSPGNFMAPLTGLIYDFPYFGRPNYKFTYRSKTVIYYFNSFLANEISIPTTATWNDIFASLRILMECKVNIVCKYKYSPGGHFI